MPKILDDFEIQGDLTMDCGVTYFPLSVLNMAVKCCEYASMPYIFFLFGICSRSQVSVYRTIGPLDDICIKASP